MSIMFRLGRTAALAVTLGIVCGTAALAQDDSAPPAVSPTAAKLSVETTSVETLLSNPRSRAVVEAALPGIEKHPSYETFKGLTLVAIAPYSDGAITKEKLATIQTGLDRLSSSGR